MRNWYLLHARIWTLTLQWKNLWRWVMKHKRNSHSLHRSRKALYDSDQDRYETVWEKEMCQRMNKGSYKKNYWAYERVWDFCRITPVVNFKPVPVWYDYNCDERWYMEYGSVEYDIRKRRKHLWNHKENNSDTVRKV